VLDNVGRSCYLILTIGSYKTVTNILKNMNKMIILLFSSIVLGFLLSVFLIKQYNIDVPPIFTTPLITGIGYFLFKNKIEIDEN
jgi:hypothetical protein